MSLKIGTGFFGALRLGGRDAFRKWLYSFAPVNYVVTPLAASLANVSASAATPTVLAVAAGAGSTSLVKGGISYVAPDVPRAITVTSGGNDSAKTALVTGLSPEGAPQTEQIALANAGTAHGRKTWSGIASIVLSAAGAGTVEAGFADVFDVPVAVYNASQILTISWGAGGLVLARDTGTLVLADTTKPASALTGAPRGTYAPSTASNGANVLGLSVAGLAISDSERGVNTDLYGVFPA